MDTPKPQRVSRTKRTPLSYERVAILLAVAGGPIDKARIADKVLADTVGAVVLSTSTAYYLISELTQDNHLQVNGSYVLTEKGYRTLHHELGRVEQERRILKQRLHI